MIIFKNTPTIKDFVVITLIEFKGSVPQSLGAKALVSDEGLLEGTIGGGKLEAQAINLAKEVLQNQNSDVCQIVEWNLTRDVGMTCGGVVKLLFEVRRQKKWKIVVFGAGHVAQELVPLLTKLDCHVTCIDAREEWVFKLQAADNLDRICHANPNELVLQFSDDCFFVLMTQGHSTDVPILEKILKTKKSPYVGVIGSRTKKLKIKDELKQLDLRQEQIESFICPIGLEFGNSTPIEIAFSVVAQLMQVRDLNLSKVVTT